MAGAQITRSNPQGARRLRVSAVSARPISTLVLLRDGSLPMRVGVVGMRRIVAQTPDGTPTALAHAVVSALKPAARRLSANAGKSWASSFRSRGPWALQLCMFAVACRWTAGGRNALVAR